jgi:predicted DNA binding CopG/RHH family protein
MKAKMPRSDSIRELATFWQNHDITDFEDEVEEVRDAVFQREQVVVGVPLSTDEHQAIRHEAAARGLDEAELIHQWVKERLGRP